MNIPAGDITGVRVRPMGDSYLQTAGYELVSEEGDRRVVRRQRTIAQSDDPATDTHAYQNGFITITPLRFDWTAHEWMGELGVLEEVEW